jgi:hypothetical protein
LVVLPNESLISDLVYYNIVLEGPTILWGQLKGKKVKSNDGKNLGEIGKVSENYVRLEEGKVKKNKFWIPKYFADTYDGKVLWLLATEEEIESRFHFGKEPPPEQFEQDFESFESAYGKKSKWDVDKVGVTKERTIGVPSKPEGSSGYKNVRDLK